MAATLIDAMVSGVFAGNIYELSLPGSFPKMAAMEADHGGLVRAMLVRMKERRAAKQQVEEHRQKGEEVEELTRPGGPAGPGGTLTSFRNGLEVWTEALQRELSDEIRLNRRVTSIAGPDQSQSHVWKLTVEGGKPVEADAVVFTIPSPLAAPLLTGLDRTLGQTVSDIPTAGLAVVALGYLESDIGQAPDGFGFLVPRGEGIRLLGCLWDSSVFPGRAEPEKVLLRAMIGGAHDPEAVDLDDVALLEIARRDLATVMGLEAEPILTRIFRHALGIGQYTLGHGERMDTIHARLDRLPGLWLAGSSYYGISMNNCIQKAGEQASEIARFLGHS
jgi:oxygen-dependent protoporphyrinogen oxidase